MFDNGIALLPGLRNFLKMPDAQKSKRHLSAISVPVPAARAPVGRRLRVLPLLDLYRK